MKLFWTSNFGETQRPFDQLFAFLAFWLFQFSNGSYTVKLAVWLQFVLSTMCWANFKIYRIIQAGLVTRLWSLCYRWELNFRANKRLSWCCQTGHQCGWSLKSEAWINIDQMVLSLVHSRFNDRFVRENKHWPFPTNRQLGPRTIRLLVVTARALSGLLNARSVAV